MEIENETELFISLNQFDGRSIKGLKFPFGEVIRSVCFVCMELDSDQNKANIFDLQKKKIMSV